MSTSVALHECVQGLYIIDEDNNNILSALTILTKPFCSSASCDFSSLFCAMARLNAVLSLCIDSSSWSRSTELSLARCTDNSISSIRISFSDINLQHNMQVTVSTIYSKQADFYCITLVDTHVVYQPVLVIIYFSVFKKNKIVPLC